MRHMILENLKQYPFLVMKLGIIDQLLRYINKLKGKTKPHNLESKKVKEHVLNSAHALLKRREMVFKSFESGIFLKL